MMKVLSGERGVSLVEIILVVVIMMIAATWAFMRIADAQQAARLSRGYAATGGWSNVFIPGMTSFVV